MVGARLDPSIREERAVRDEGDRTASLTRAEELDLKEVQADVREAYERGRRDERASRRRHPVLMTLTFAAAACGVALLALAAVNGSFSGGGAVADQNLNAAVTRAEPQVRDAASQAGQSLRDAGVKAKAKVDGAPG
jgi:predicted anti-sigma-YlaC factor YlaD